MTKGIFIMFFLLLLLFVGYFVFGFSFVNIPRTNIFSSVTSTNTIVSSSFETKNSPRVTSSIAEFEQIPTVKKCKITGCSSQICSDEDVVTDCLYREEYSCYQKAKCEIQNNGKCGWTETSDIKACLLQYE